MHLAAEHTKARQALTSIFAAAIRAADPTALVKKTLSIKNRRLIVGKQSYPLDKYERVLVVGGGKAVVPMAAAVEQLLKSRLDAGLVVTRYGHGGTLNKIEVVEAGHPIPDRAGLAAGQRVLDMLRKAGERDLVIALISGGGSALLPVPVDGVTLTDKQVVTALLLRAGGTIQEINTVRKHLSQLKGGNMVTAAAPATMLSLVLSDVVGNDLASIASGPTVPDPTTFQDASAILHHYELWDKIPQAVKDHLVQGSRSGSGDTPKPSHPAFGKVNNVIVGDVRVALNAAAAQVKRLGYHPLVLTSSLVGETREVAKVFGAMVRELAESDRPIKRPAALIAGGETTVTVRGQGTGGRCQEFTLAMALEIAGMKKVTAFAFGTDGTDGSTDVAGAMADGNTLEKARDLGLQPQRFLDQNDSYTFFHTLAQTIQTGPTRTNVTDLYFALVGK
ncbi:MAG: glycerate kinase type-2 family protein [Nitrospirota bacterium]